VPNDGTKVCLFGLSLHKFNLFITSIRIQKLGFI